MNIYIASTRHNKHAVRIAKRLLAQPGHQICHHRDRNPGIHHPIPTKYNWREISPARKPGQPAGAASPPPCDHCGGNLITCARKRTIEEFIKGAQDPAFDFTGLIPAQLCILVLPTNTLPLIISNYFVANDLPLIVHDPEQASDHYVPLLFADAITTDDASLQFEIDNIKPRPQPTPDFLRSLGIRI